MKNLQLLLAVAALALSATPLLADNALAPPKTGAFTTRPAPSIKVAACLPDGASCNAGGDCCSGNCAPQHHKCGR